MNKRSGAPSTKEAGSSDEAAFLVDIRTGFEVMYSRIELLGHVTLQAMMHHHRDPERGRVRFGRDRSRVSMMGATACARATLEEDIRGDVRTTDTVDTMPRLRGWVSRLLPLAHVFRMTSIPQPRRRQQNKANTVTAVLEPEPEIELPSRSGRKILDWPILNVDTLGPEDDEGGPTSYYSGEVTGITQVLRLMHNISAGKDADEGLRDVPKDKRIFDFDR